PMPPKVERTLDQSSQIDAEVIRQAQSDGCCALHQWPLYSRRCEYPPLSTDTVLGFKWGDMGVIQFWISETDLENHYWENVKVRLAGH
ncbi:DUF1963 domain-containing protein, partial [uncultured Tateyamaria sp.]|uniref:DUF1963 domain-containing protein n=1 Tax=uncultured Tateyamaria sp. TaxID=455651 RepID=UPI0026283D3F